MAAVHTRALGVAYAVHTAARNSHLRNVGIARLASVTGRWAGTVALSVYAYQAGGATLVGVMGASRSLPAVAAGPIASWLLKRLRGDQVLLAGDLARVFVVGGAAAIVLSNASTEAVFVLAGLETLLSTIVRPLQNASLPALARTPLELTATHLGLTTIESIGMLLGPVVSGAMLAVLAAPGRVLLVTAGTYLVSALMLAQLPRWEPVAAELERDDKATPTTLSLLADVRLRFLFTVTLAQSALSGLIGVLIVVSALRLLDLGESGVGTLNAAVGVGGLLGTVVAVALLGRKRVASDFGLGVVLCSLPIAVIGLAPHLAVALVFLAILGIGIALVDFTGLTLFQRATPHERLPQMFSVLQGTSVSALGAGELVAPLLIDAIGLRGALIACGALLPILIGLFWRRLVLLDELQDVDDETIDLLRAVEIFAPLRLPSLERLGSSLVPVEAPAGVEVVRQGDPGDSYFIVRSGTLDVAIDGVQVNTLGPGDGFGEIALLRDVPRTATITTTSPVELFALDREPFLAVVTGNTTSHGAADVVIDRHLGATAP